MLKIKVENSSTSSCILRVSGDVDENAQSILTPIAASLSGKSVEVDCSGIQRMNSIGTAEWMRFWTSVGAKRPIRFVLCSEAYMIFAMSIRFSAGIVESARLQTICSACRKQIQICILRSDPEHLAPCPKCGKTAEPDPPLDIFREFFGASGYRVGNG